MTEKQYLLFDASLSHSLEILEHIWTLQKRSKQININDIQSFFNKTPSYTARAIKFLEGIGIISLNLNSIEIINEAYKEADGSKEKFLFLIRERVINLKPFVEYCYFISNGKKGNEAAKLITSIYKLNLSSDKIDKLFSTWIKVFSFKVEKNSSEIEVDAIKYVESNNNELMIQKFLKEKFGEFYSKLSYDVLKDLSLALGSYKSNGRKALNDAGRALEDFLRLDFAVGIDLTKCSGIGQIANDLPQHKITTSKHNSIILALGQMRSMGDAHGVDMKTGERWAVTEQAAFAYILLVISTMLSLLEFKKSNSLIF